MKIRGSISRVWFYSAVALLVCSFLLAAAFRITRNSSRHSLSATSAAARMASPTVSSTDKSALLQAYGKLPLSFMENQGQLAQEVRYAAHGARYDLFLTSQEAVVTLRHSQHLDFSPRHRAASLKASANDCQRSASILWRRFSPQSMNRSKSTDSASVLRPKRNSKNQQNDKQQNDKYSKI